MGWIGLVLLALVLLLGPLVLAIAAHTKATVLASRLAALKAKVEGLETQLAEYTRTSTPRPRSAEAPQEAPPVSAPVELTPPQTAETPVLAPPTASAPRLEEKLTSRWFLWLGAAALALAGLFLINYAVESGLLTPAGRIVLALLLGIALMIGGEAVRRESLPRYVPANRVDLAAGALTSAGVFVSFAAVYAAHALYELVSPLIAFLGLGAIALVAFALAALHAPIVAILGLLAGFLTPALVASDRAPVWGLFGYLTLVMLASLAVVRYRSWPWLAFGSIAGGAVWTFLWLTKASTAAIAPTLLAMVAYGVAAAVGLWTGSHHRRWLWPLLAVLAGIAAWIFLAAPKQVAQADVLALVCFQALVAAACIYLAQDKSDGDESPVWHRLEAVAPIEWAAWTAISLSSLLIAATIGAAPKLDLNLLILAGLAGLAIYAGRRWQRFDAIFLWASLAVVSVMALWPLGAQLESAREQVEGISGPPFEGLIGSAVWPYLLRSLLFAAFLAVAGYVAEANAKRPHLWAAISTIGSALLLAITYTRLRDVSSNSLWAIISIAAALLALAAAKAFDVRREEYASRLALGIYSAAVLAGVSCAFAFVFRNAWLTVALALQLPALAWLEQKLSLRELRFFALVVAGIVLLRLVLNPYILDYEAIDRFGAQWILYGYGVPAAAFLAAARVFARSEKDLTTAVLETGALLFALLLVGFEIRLGIEGRLESSHLTFFELSLHSLVWLAVGWWRARAYMKSGRLIDAGQAGLLLALALGGIFIGQLLALNPAMSGENIGDWPILNKLLLGYLAPAVLLVLMVRDLEEIPELRQARTPVAVGALVLAFTWVTLENKHAFQGDTLSLWHQSPGEYYAYSLVWLLFAFALLAAGLWRGQAGLRYGALAVLLVTVLKVFISDMAGLEGLYRVASFFGLGLSLVAIGWIYQRFVYPVRPALAQGSQ
jgi:uncharacterized membrane protein